MRQMSNDTSAHFLPTSIWCSQYDWSLLPSNKPLLQIRKTMNIAMLNDRVLILPEEEDSISEGGIRVGGKTKGGLYVPEDAKDTPHTARVIATWGERKTEDGELVFSDVQEGDRVIFPKYAGVEVTLDEKKYIIIRESELLAVLAPEEDEPSEPWKLQSE